MDSVINIEDCGTKESIVVTSIIDGGEIIQALTDRILGRVIAEPILDSEGKELFPVNTMLDEDALEVIDELNLSSLKIRSPMTCDAPIGVCANCYGRDLARGHLVHRGEAVGVVAAQSIGEPGTQLTMRTFHIGGAASSSSEDNAIYNKSAGAVSFSDDMKTVTNKDKLEVVVSRNAMCSISDVNGRVVEQYRVPYGATLEVDDAADLTDGVKVASWDPYTRPIISETSGKIKFTDIDDGVTVREQLDELTGLSSIEIIEVADRTSAGRDMVPTIEIVDSKKKPVLIGEFNQPAVYPLPAGGLVNLIDGQKINAGEVIARMPLVASKTKDITGGLPRVADLFEARKPKDAAVLSEQTGVVSFGKETKGKVRLVITPEGATKKSQNTEMLIPKLSLIHI